VFLALFGSSQSVSFDCEYISGDLGTLGTVYWCNVQNAVIISSPDEAHVDSISGTHLTGKNNDNVDFFYVSQGQVNYFPHGLNKTFKNLRGITIGNAGLKEVHQRDLKDYPKLMNLYLYNNNLQILEKDLFEFNPNLETIYLHTNKITHIDPNVFDKLSKLKSLYLNSNTCINMEAANNPTEVQKIIKTAQAQCISLDYSSLEQKVKYLEKESRVLDSQTLKKELEILKTEIKNSAFPSSFQDQIKLLNATLIKMEKEDAEDLAISGLNGKMTSISDTITLINNNYQDLNRRFMKLISALENAYANIK